MLNVIGNSVVPVFPIQDQAKTAREKFSIFTFPGIGLSLFVMNFDDRFFLEIFITANIIKYCSSFFSLSWELVRDFAVASSKGFSFANENVLTLNRKREVK